MCRFRERLAQDQAAVIRPDVDSPFVDEVDVINRLLPYHLFQQPKDDLERIVSIKGKEKAEEIQGWSTNSASAGRFRHFFVKTRNLLWSAIGDARKL
jgi:hypothetical protein